MNAVTKIKPHLAAISAPDAIRKLPGWLIWRYEHIDGEAKPRKVPYYAAGGKRHGVQGRPEDRQSLVTFEAAKAAAARRGFDGIGLALLADFGIVVADFDHCNGPAGLDATVERVTAETYTEYSPSGQGVHAFYVGNLGNNKSHDGPFGFEVFSSKGFVTYTGNAIPSLVGDVPGVAEVPESLLNLCAARFGRRREAEADDDWLNGVEQPVGLNEAQIREMLDALDPDMGHAQWLNVGMALHHETAGEGFHHWDAWSAKGTKYPGEDALRKRWDSLGRDETRRQVTARSLIKMAQEAGAYISAEVASAAEFDAVASAAEFAESPVAQGEAPKTKYKVVSGLDFSQGQPPSWLVKGVLPQADLVVVYGESGSGKSFAVLDVCMAIARGLPWRGHRTKQGGVVYIAAEGGGGFRKRLAAYAQHHAIDLGAVPFGVIHAAPNLLDKADALDVAKSILAWGRPAVVVVDTLAQSTPGANENAGEDMGKALKHCNGIHRATGAVVVLVHHSGKDKAKGARGWSGLRAAADAEIEVIRATTGRALKVTKQKDGEDGAEFGFDLQVVQVGIDEDGDPIDSCVVIEAEVPVTEGVVAGRKLGRWERAVLAVLNSWGQKAGIEPDALIDEVIQRDGPAEPGKRDQRRKNIRRAINQLITDGDSAISAEDDGTLTVH